MEISGVVKVNWGALRSWGGVGGGLGAGGASPARRWFN